MNNDFASRKKDIIDLGSKCFWYYRGLSKDLRDPNDSVIRLARALDAMHQKESKKLKKRKKKLQQADSPI